MAWSATSVTDIIFPLAMPLITYLWWFCDCHPIQRYGYVFILGIHCEGLQSDHLDQLWAYAFIQKNSPEARFQVHGAGNKKPDLRSSLHAAGLQKHNDIANSNAFL